MPPRVAAPLDPKPPTRVALHEESDTKRALEETAASVGSASWIGTLWLTGALLWACLACAGQPPNRPGASPASTEERYCAWYGDAQGGILYFGQAAFWSAYHRSGGDPEADLEIPGPQRVGRFDLGSERFLPPLEVTVPGARSGVWDVHAHANGRIYFTTFFDTMGFVDPQTGAVQRVDALGRGLNEIAPDPPAGHRAAPKTPAFDAPVGEIWTTMDLLPAGPGTIRHDAYVLAPDGSELRRIARPEVQFVSAGPDGTLHRAEVEGTRLWLHRSAPGVPPRRVELDPAFSPDFDFVQDIKLTPDGTAVVTRWSGLVHVVDPDGGVRSQRLPRPDGGGLYYTGVLTGRRLCATYCDGLSVVCRNLP
jgi:hypothetical protein